MDDDRRLAHHAAMHGDRPAVGRHAVPAAQRAARLGAHKEAAEHYRLALRFHDGDPVTRAHLLEALSYECYLVDALAEALSARLKAMELAELGADPQARGGSSAGCRGCRGSSAATPTASAMPPGP